MYIISTIALTCILLYVFMCYHVQKSVQNNADRHLYNNNQYAHFSRITANNMMFYPKYILARPTKYVLKAGDALKIPKFYWHWVISDANTFGLNYWFEDSDYRLDSPEQIHKFCKPVNLLDHQDIVNKCQNIQSLDAESNSLNCVNSINCFVQQSKSSYLITLPSFVNNKDFKETLDKIVQQPKFIRKHKLGKNYNYWYCYDKFDTGLHYDDNNGILCVLSGSKTVYLYPPSDSKYLYPHDIMPKWAVTNSEDFYYNIYLSKQRITTQYPSARFLYESFKDSKHHQCKIVDFMKLKIKQPIIYGIKKNVNDDLMWWEYYFYNLNKDRTNINQIRKTNFNHIEIVELLKQQSNLTQLQNQRILPCSPDNLTILSFEVYDDTSKMDYKIDYHFNSRDTYLPFFGNTYTTGSSRLKSTFIVDEQQNFILNIDEYLATYFNLTHMKSSILKCINRYKYVHKMSFYKKSDDIIAIQWYGLSNYDFLEFLIQYNWNANIIELIRNQPNDFEKEITINYRIIDNDLVPFRTSIYGSL